jgi:RNA polymerase sigma-70 factor (ECF subfamily)
MRAPNQPTPDHQLLSQWVHDHGRAVRGYLLATVHRADLADDLLQEVFRRAWEARERYREAGTARAYLIRIADRLACDYFRKVDREINIAPENWTSLEPAGLEAEPLQRLAQAEARKRLAVALEQLTPVQRRVLMLRYYSDLGFAEIAESVGCPLNTALSHCRRGLLALRTMLSEVEA